MIQGPDGHQLNAFEPDMVPMDQDERAWARHIREGYVAPQLAPPEAEPPLRLGDGAPVPIVAAPVGGGNVGAGVHLLAASSTVSDTARRIIPMSKPVLLIGEASHQQLMEIAHQSKANLVSASFVEQFVPLLSRVLIIGALVLLLLVIVAHVYRRARK